MLRHVKDGETEARSPDVQCPSYYIEPPHTSSQHKADRPLSADCLPHEGMMPETFLKESRRTGPDPVTEVPDGAVLAPKFQAGVGGWEAGSEGVSTQALGCGLLQSLLPT